MANDQAPGTGNDLASALARDLQESMKVSLSQLSEADFLVTERALLDVKAERTGENARKESDRKIRKMSDKELQLYVQDIDRANRGPVSFGGYEAKK